MKTGNQEPTFKVVGDYAYSYGSEVVEMFEEDGGATFYPSQKYEMELFLARNKDGSPSALTIGISKPRQNGKSYAARFYAVYMGVFEHRQVLYSAHHSSTTNKMFKALCDLFESPERYPDFANDVKNISHARGYEGIYFNDWVDDDGRIQPGGCIEFVTRTNSGSRGGTYSVIVIDEGQELTFDQQEAMLPVMSAASEVKDVTKMPQQIFIGTPPSASCHGTVFMNMHNTAHSAEKGEVWWLEWSVEAKSTEGVISSPEEAIELAYRTNPAMGYRIAEKTVLNEYETMSLDGYMRERLGWWSPTAEHRTDYAISKEAWDSCKTKQLRPEGKTAYGIKFSVDGSTVCLSGAVITQEGRIHIELIEQKSTAHGTRWLAEWLNERYNKASCVVIDGRNGVDVLVDRISDIWKVKGSIIRPTTKEVLASVGMICDAITEKTLTWHEHQEVLKESAITSVKRPIAGGWGFGGEASTPIESCALAVFGAKTSKRDPSKKMLIG
jgi:hypothetical protein